MKKNYSKLKSEQHLLILLISLFTFTHHLLSPGRWKAPESRVDTISTHFAIVWCIFFVFFLTLLRRQVISHLDTLTASPLSSPFSLFEIVPPFLLCVFAICVHFFKENHDCVTASSRIPLIWWNLFAISSQLLIPNTPYRAAGEWALDHRIVATNTLYWWYILFFWIITYIV